MSAKNRKTNQPAVRPGITIIETDDFETRDHRYTFDELVLAIDDCADNGRYSPSFVRLLCLLEATWMFIENMERQTTRIEIVFPEAK